LEIKKEVPGIVFDHSPPSMDSMVVPVFSGADAFM
jgi:hypothetical protein